MSALWTGLSKLASYESKGKEPIAFEAVCNYLHKTSKDPSPSTIRNRAMIITSFFGVRRSAEVRAFVMDDVVKSPSGNWQLKVRCQKNDQIGLGMVCTIPKMDVLGTNSPTRVWEEWLNIRPQFAKSTDGDQPVFVTTTGSRHKIGSNVSADAYRKIITSQFEGLSLIHI